MDDNYKNWLTRIASRCTFPAPPRNVCRENGNSDFSWTHTNALRRTKGLSKSRFTQICNNFEPCFFLSIGDASFVDLHFLYQLSLTIFRWNICSRFCQLLCPAKAFLPIAHRLTIRSKHHPRPRTKIVRFSLGI